MLELLGDDRRLPLDLVPLVLRNRELPRKWSTPCVPLSTVCVPRSLTTSGPVAALRQLVAEVRARHGIAIGLEVTGDQVRLSDQCELTLYRVAQEALGNVVRHAHATHTSVGLHFGEQVVLTVTDNGRGIPASKVLAAGSGGGARLDRDARKGQPDRRQSPGAYA